MSDDVRRLSDELARDPSSRVSLSKLHKLRLVLRHGLV